MTTAPILFFLWCLGAVAASSAIAWLATTIYRKWRDSRLGEYADDGAPDFAEDDEKFYEQAVAESQAQKLEAMVDKKLQTESEEVALLKKKIAAMEISFKGLCGGQVKNPEAIPMPTGDAMSYVSRKEALEQLHNETWLDRPDHPRISDSEPHFVEKLVAGVGDLEKYYASLDTEDLALHVKAAGAAATRKREKLQREVEAEQRAAAEEATVILEKAGVKTTTAAILATANVETEAKPSLVASILASGKKPRKSKKRPRK